MSCGIKKIINARQFQYRDLLLGWHAVCPLVVNTNLCVPENLVTIYRFTEQLQFFFFSVGKKLNFEVVL